jgi:hypothetical protein
VAGHASGEIFCGLKGRKIRGLGLEDLRFFGWSGSLEKFFEEKNGNRVTSRDEQVLTSKRSTLPKARRPNPSLYTHQKSRAFEAKVLNLKHSVMPHTSLRCAAAATALLLALGVHCPSARAAAQSPFAKPVRTPNVRINQPPVRPPAELIEARKTDAWQAWDAKKNRPKSI